MGLKYEPRLDGLRALAVAAVILFHDGALPGGSLGVDLFFVLSGYLITSILAPEARATGAVNIKRFLSRRAARLYPALGLLLVAYVVAAPFVLSVWAPARWGDALIAALYLTNISEAISTRLGPLSHTWSLALEWQFYLIWPLVMIGLSKLRPGVAVAVLLVAWVALTASRSLSPLGAHRQVVTFFLPPFHATGLVLGAALALAPKLRIPGWLGLIALAGLCLGDTTRHFLLLAPLAEVAAAVVIANPPRFLEWPRLVQVGRVSYGIYLWHLPIGLALGWPKGPMGVLAIAVPATLLAGASYYGLERRFQAKQPSGRPIPIEATP